MAAFKNFKWLIVAPNKTLTRIFFYSTYLLYKAYYFFSPGFIRNAWLSSNLSVLNDEIITVLHVDKFDIERKIVFSSPNYLCDSRYYTFSNKEPETLEWIDYCQDGVFYDIGANIGLYSIYYALTKKSKVYSFEPCPHNLSVLTKNINYNFLSAQVNLVTNPLGTKNGFKSLYFFDKELIEGGAGHIFDSEYDEHGSQHNYKNSVCLLGFSLDWMLDSGMLTDFPVNIKIDVDGTELNVLQGAIKTLNDDRCRNLLIEVNEKVFESDLENLLINCGFSLKSKTYKRHSSQKNEFGNFSYIANQIWAKG